VLGASYRGGVKETAFSGVFALVAALKEKGAEVMVHDPLYSDEELSRFGFVPFQVGTESDVAILQADHAEYRSWGQTELPGITTLMDGRKALDPLNWPDANYLAIGTRIGRSLGGVKSQ
jgi:UDP-N-acetyl-D-mannosaminuronate dehydrogenase